MPAKTAEPRGGALAVAEEERRGVGDLGQPRAGHLEDADLVGGAEAVLDGAQDAELVPALAFEVEHRVHHVLDHAGARDLSLLGDVAHEHHGQPAALCEGGELVRAGADLRDRARRALHRVEPHGLDRVDHGDPGALALQRGQDVAQVGLGGEPDGRVAQAQALRAHPDLRRGLLARDVGRPAAPRGRRRRRPGGAGWTCRCPGRPPRAWPRPAPARRRAPGRARPARSACAEAAPPPSRGRPAPRRARAPAPRAFAPGPRESGASSWMVFQAPQASQRPDHFECTAPQAEQT